MRLRWWLALAVVAMCLYVCTRETAPSVVIATFNIEDFPKDRRQVDGAFAEIEQLGASIVAVQEITEPELFARTARERFGDDWDFVYTHTDRQLRALHPVHHLGVLFDRSAWTLVSIALHDDTRLEEGRHKPTFEARLRPTRGGGAIVRLLVVHLKAGGDGRDIRARQLVALRGVVQRASQSGDRVVLLGDFNATHDTYDRADIAALADTTGLAWATESLGCSAFWSRDDGCPRSRLDHVLTSATAVRVEAAGACATEGCDWQASCPIYADHVSDHCPVVVELGASD